MPAVTTEVSVSDTDAVYSDSDGCYRWYDQSCKKVFGTIYLQIYTLKGEDASVAYDGYKI